MKEDLIVKEIDGKIIVKLRGSRKTLVFKDKKKYSRKKKHEDKERERIEK